MNKNSVKVIENTLTNNGIKISSDDPMSVDIGNIEASLTSIINSGNSVNKVRSVLCNANGDLVSVSSNKLQTDANITNASVAITNTSLTNLNPCIDQSNSRLNVDTNSINTVSIEVNSGNNSNGVQRVCIATDDSNLSTINTNIVTLSDTITSAVSSSRLNVTKYNSDEELLYQMHNWYELHKLYVKITGLSTDTNKFDYISDETRYSYNGDSNPKIWAADESYNIASSRATYPLLPVIAYEFDIHAQLEPQSSNLWTEWGVTKSISSVTTTSNTIMMKVYRSGGAATDFTMSINILGTTITSNNFTTPSLVTSLNFVTSNKFMMILYSGGHNLLQAHFYVYNSTGYPKLFHAATLGNTYGEDVDGKYKNHYWRQYVLLRNNTNGLEYDSEFGATIYFDYWARTPTRLTRDLMYYTVVHIPNLTKNSSATSENALLTLYQTISNVRTFLAPIYIEINILSQDNVDHKLYVEYSGETSTTPGSTTQLYNFIYSQNDATRNHNHSLYSCYLVGLTNKTFYIDAAYKYIGYDLESDNRPVLYMYSIPQATTSSDLFYDVRIYCL